MLTVLSACAFNTVWVMGIKRGCLSLENPNVVDKYCDSPHVEDMTLLLMLKKVNKY